MCNYNVRNAVYTVLLFSGLAMGQGAPVPVQRGDQRGPSDHFRDDEDAPQSDRRERSIERTGADEDFNFPDPDRPWGSARQLDPYRLGRRGYPRTYGGRRYYDNDYTYRFGVPYDDDPRSDDLEQAYRQGVEDGRHFERYQVRAERGQGSYQEAMADGHALFSARRYGDAARSFLLASRLNQGDPAARVSAAHAQIALGKYRPAARLLHRAFELQPKMAYLPLDVRTAYGNSEDFKSHLESLNRAFELEPNDPDLCLALGYFLLFSDQPVKAEKVLSRAVELAPNDGVIRTLQEGAALTTADE